MLSNISSISFVWKQMRAVGTKYCWARRSALRQYGCPCRTINSFLLRLTDKSEDLYFFSNF